jgi:hypothetical protein
LKIIVSISSCVLLVVVAVVAPSVYAVPLDTLEMVKQYCLDHTSDILAGKNPISDLITTGMINSYDFTGKTCGDIPSMIGELHLQQSGNCLILKAAGVDCD